MATVDTADGTTIHYELAGAGDPLVLVHGSWGDSSGWGFVTAGLADTFQVVTYDRRGHGRSGGPPAEGTVHDDVADLAALIEALGFGPVHVCGSSYGTNISLRLAIEHPDLVQRVAGHEPPLLRVIADEPAHAEVYQRTTASMEVVRRFLQSGDDDRGAEVFVEEIAIGPGMWALMPPEMRDTFTHNGQTFLGELRDPDALAIDLHALAAAATPLLLTHGDASPPMFAPIVERLRSALPDARWHTFAGAGHVPHFTHPTDYVATMTDFFGTSGG